MSPHDRDREYLAALEPELRTLHEDYPRRHLSPPLVLLMSLLRLYVVACIALVLVTFVRVMHH